MNFIRGKKIEPNPITEVKEEVVNNSESTDTKKPNPENVIEISNGEKTLVEQAIDRLSFNDKEPNENGQSETKTKTLSEIYEPELKPKKSKGRGRRKKTPVVVPARVLIVGVDNTIDKISSVLFGFEEGDMKLDEYEVDILEPIVEIELSNRLKEMSNTELLIYTTFFIYSTKIGIAISNRRAKLKAMKEEAIRRRQTAKEQENLGRGNKKRR